MRSGMKNLREGYISPMNIEVPFQEKEPTARGWRHIKRNPNPAFDSTQGALSASTALGNSLCVNLCFLELLSANRGFRSQGLLSSCSARPSNMTRWLQYISRTTSHLELCCQQHVARKKHLGRSRNKPRQSTDCLCQDWEV
jgi:hypothetical protein